MESQQAPAAPQAPAGSAADAAGWAAQVAAAWAAGSAGWDHLATTWGVAAAPVSSDAASTTPAALDAAATTSAPTDVAPPRCWWDAPPWCGQIPDTEFRAIVAAYVAHHGSYTPDLPEREPGVLREWLRAHGYTSAPAAPAAA